MITLLDVNVLIGLVDAEHIHHAAAMTATAKLQHHGAVGLH